MEFLPPKTSDNCTNCPLATNPERIQVVHSRIPKGCKILFIAEAPGRTEAEKGEPLIGAAGQILMSALQEIGLSRDEVGLANVVSCLDKDSRILMNDFSYKKIKDLKIGDEIVSAEEYSDLKHRKFLTSKVEEIYNKGIQEVIKITTKSGKELICTPDHWLFMVIGGTTNVWTDARISFNQYLKVFPNIVEIKKSLDYYEGWLSGYTEGDGHITNKPHDGPKFKATSVDKEIRQEVIKVLKMFGIDGKEGKYIGGIQHKEFTEVRAYKNIAFEIISKLMKKVYSNPSLDYKRGWLAGIFDAEGSFGFKTKSLHITIIEYPELKDIVKSFGKDIGVDFAIYKKGAYLSSFSDIFNFFQSTHPVLKRKQRIDNSTIKCLENDRVIKVEKIGKREVYDIKTSSKTFFAEGIFVHNCRPPGNRVPTSIEADACQPFLDEEIKQANPEVIVLLGSTPLKRFLQEESGIMKARGKVHDILGPDFSGKIIPTYHPAFLLPNRQPEKKSEFIEDLKLAKREAGYEDKSKEKSTDTSYYVVRDKTQFDWLISQLHENDLWACDTETTGFDFRNDKIFIITFSWKAKTAVLVDFRLIDSFKEYAWTKIKEVLENKSKKVFQNGSFDIEFFMANDIFVNNYYRDTILMDYLLDENELHGLEVLASRYTDMGGYDLPLEVYVKEHKIENYATIPPEIIHPYACADADVTLRCYQAMVPKIEEQGLGTIMNMIMQFQKLLIVTEFNGVTIDIDHLNKMTKEYEKKIKDELKEVFKSSEVQLYIEKRKRDFLVKYDEKFESNPKYYLKRYGNKDEYLTTMLTKYPEELEFNPNSSKQKKELLIDQMKLPIIKYTKDSKTHKPTKNPSLDADVLEEYSKKNEVCKHLSNVVSFTHLKSTFLDGMREKLDENNKIHTDYFLFSTDTGRPSSASPNLNNIPRTSTAGGIKDIFRSDVGNYWLMEADGSQMEFRCIEGSQRVLMGDFSYKPIKDVKVGDKVLSIDENPPGNRSRRKLRVAEVLAFHEQGKKHCVEISSERKKKIICTPDHKFLYHKDFLHSGIWRSLRNNDSCYTFPISGISSIEDYNKGMAFGLYLTDGHLEKEWKNTLSANICQNDISVIKWYSSFLKKNNILHTLDIKKKGKYIRISSSNVSSFLNLIGNSKKSFDYSRGVIAGALLGDGWFGTLSKINPQQEIGLGLSILHPEVLQLIYMHLNNLKKQYNFKFRIYNFPIKEDDEQKPFYHFYFSSNCMYLFPQLIPGEKQEKFYTHLSKFSTLQNMISERVKIKKLHKMYDTFDLTTSTGTFICEDFFVHNCMINYSKDSQALIDLESKYDIHKMMAASAKGISIPPGNISKELYNSIVKDITKDERQDAKTVIFGIMYGRGARSVSDQLGISIIQAQKIIDSFFYRYPGAQKYLQSCIGNARKLGYVTNLFGRRRRLANINSRLDEERSTAERQAQNSTIQSGASDMVLLAGTRIANQLWSKGMKTRLVLTVYDSLVYNIPEDELEFVVPLVYTEMTKKFRSDIIVPLDCEVKVGKNWGSLIEVKPLENWKLQFDKIKSELKGKGVEIGS